MRVIMTSAPPTITNVVSPVLQYALWQGSDQSQSGRSHAQDSSASRLIRNAQSATAFRRARRRRLGPARSVTVNLAESPLGWLYSRGHVTRRQFDAGEALRGDWERAQLAPGVTMRWDLAPSRARRHVGVATPRAAQIDAQRRFDAAVAAPGRAERYLVAHRLRGRGDARGGDRAGLAGPGGQGRVCLALDRVADFYRIDK